jgi:O-antigen/teichoic acid export membrane protein
LLIGEMPRQREREHAFISTALLISCGAGCLLGLIFVAIAPLLSHDLARLRANAGSIALFTLGVALTGATSVLDLALVGMLRGSVQFWRNMLFSVAKLALLALAALALARGSTTAIYVAWILGMLISLVAVARSVAGDRKPLAAYRPDLSLLHGLKASAAWHHLQNLALQLATLVLPLIVIAMLSATEDAYFYTSWLLAGFLFFPPYALTIGLYTIGARAPHRLSSSMRLTLALAVALSLAGVVVVWLGASFALQIFGRSYQTEAAWSLRIVVLAVFPLIIKDHFVACCRVRRRIVGGTLAITAASLLELAAAAAGAALGGLVGLCIGWVVAVFVGVLPLLPTVFAAAFPQNWRSASTLAPESHIA